MAPLLDTWMPQLYSLPSVRSGVTVPTVSSSSEHSAGRTAPGPGVVSWLLHREFLVSHQLPAGAPGSAWWTSSASDSATCEAWPPGIPWVCRAGGAGHRV